MVVIFRPTMRGRERGSGGTEEMQDDDRYISFMPRRYAPLPGATAEVEGGHIFAGVFWSCRETDPKITVSALEIGIKAIQTGKISPAALKSFGYHG